MTAEQPPAFAVRGLTKRYDLVTAVEGVDFTAPSGTVTALVGPRGAGKTTILRVLLGLVEASSGTVTGRRESPRDVGAVLTPRGLHPRRGARAHLSVYAAALRVPPRRVWEVLGLVGLDEDTEIKPDAMSSGQRTRLALATALLADPKVLVLDDPMAGLDHTEHGWLQDFLRKHARRGGSALLTAESLAAVLPAAEHIVVVHEGGVAYEGSATRLRRGHPDRLVVAASTPVALATGLAAEGYTDSVIRPDGRLAIAEANEAQIKAAADSARVRIESIIPDPIHPDRVLASLTKPTRVASPPMPYGIPR
ncbi:ATP-binding cassette domain-containing protein [Nocardia callitridis]|uniref:ABC transporter ATP-binding protein n=1 Tax=Nocardia callitridis TaxID=648753 RepID=A0ABP9JUI2_9NOCA